MNLRNDDKSKLLPKLEEKSEIKIENILSKKEIFFELTLMFKNAERTINKVLTLAKKILVNININEAPEAINVTNKIIAGMLHKNNIDATATKKSKLDSNVKAPKPIIAEPIAKPGRPNPFFNPLLNAVFIMNFYHYVFAIKSIKLADSNGASLSENFTLDNGQRDNYYGIGRIIPKADKDIPNANIFKICIKLTLSLPDGRS